MKRLTTILLLSCFALSLSLPVYADKKDKNHDKDRYEYRDNKGHDKKHHDSKKPHYGNDRPYYGPQPSKYNHNHSKDYKRYIKEQQIREKQYRKMMKHYHHDYTRNFWNMVRYATRGGRNVSVWQISDDAYMVRYLLNGRWYTQCIYPYAKRYGNRSVISINWSPNSAWLPIPSININL